MMKTIALLCISIFFISNAHADKIAITETISLSFSIPDSWQLATEPPLKLLEELAEHIRHDAESKKHSPTQEQLLAIAKKRLAANEVLLYNPATLAFMTLDFSHLRQGERAPTQKSIKLSAKYAGESLSQEEGVEQLTGKTQDITIDGAWYAYRYDADYLHHDEKMAFTGVIGFAPPHWFFFYYTDYSQDPMDRSRAEQVLKSLKIITK